MSQKNQKKEEDNTGGKLLTGLAVGFAAAAAGAAIGYFGRQFFNALQETGQEEKQKTAVEKCSPSCADKMADENSKDEEQVHHYDECNRLSNLDVLQMPVGKPSASLYDQLTKYYHDYVDIPKATYAAAYKVVEDIRLALSTQLRDPKLLGVQSLKIGDLVPFGSMLDGLSVIRPDRFDIMVPVMLQESCEITSLSVANKVCLKLQSDSLSCSSRETLCDGSRLVMSTKLAECLFRPFEQASRTTRFSVTVALNKSLILLQVEHPDGRPWMSIYFVPAVIVGSKLFLPDISQSSVTDDDSGTIRWLTSYARQEQWSVDRFDSSIEGHRMAMKILKAIRLNHIEMFGQVSSYHIKNVLFYVLDDLPDSVDWTENAIGERIIDLLARLAQFLNEHNLPHYFEQSVNLLSGVPEDECVNLAKFIEKKLGNNALSSLLEKRY